MTSPPYGAETTWTFLLGSSTGFTFTATAAAYSGGSGGGKAGATGLAAGEPASATGGATGGAKVSGAGRLAVAPWAWSLGALALVAAAL
jgi:hypothetical protein